MEGLGASQLNTLIECYSRYFSCLDPPIADAVRLIRSTPHKVGKQQLQAIAAMICFFESDRTVQLVPAWSQGCFAQRPADVR